MVHSMNHDINHRLDMEYDELIELKMLQYKYNNDDYIDV